MKEQAQLVTHGMAELERMALAVYKSGMFSLKTPEAAVSLFLLAQAEGLHPITALRRYHILGDGRISMRADAMLADFRTKAGGNVKWLRHDGEAAIGLWTVGGNEQEIGYTIGEARAAGLIRPGSAWIKDPGAMLRARCISRAIRMMAPEVVAGLYPPEELSDIEPPSNAPAWSATAVVKRTEAMAVAEAEVMEKRKAEEATTAALAAPDKTLAETVSTAGLPPAEAMDTRPWKDILGADEADALEFLRIRGWLKDEEGMEDLKRDHVVRIRRKPEAFTLTARNFMEDRRKKKAEFEGGMA